MENTWKNYLEPCPEFCSFPLLLFICFKLKSNPLIIWCQDHENSYIKQLTMSFYYYLKEQVKILTLETLAGKARDKEECLPASQYLPSPSFS